MHSSALTSWTCPKFEFNLLAEKMRGLRKSLATLLDDAEGSLASSATAVTGQTISVMVDWTVLAPLLVRALGERLGSEHVDVWLDHAGIITV